MAKKYCQFRTQSMSVNKARPCVINLVWCVLRSHQYSSLSSCSHLHSSLSPSLSSSFCRYFLFLSFLVSFSSHLLKHPNTCVQPTHLISSSWVISCGVLIRLIICTTLPWDLLMQKQTQCNLHIFVPVPLKSSNYQALRMISKGVALRLHRGKGGYTETLSYNWIIIMFYRGLLILLFSRQTCWSQFVKCLNERVSIQNCSGTRGAARVGFTQVDLIVRCCPELPAAWWYFYYSTDPKSPRNRKHL